MPAGLGQSLSRTRGAALRTWLGFQTSPTASKSGETQTSSRVSSLHQAPETSCSSTQMDAPGQHRPTINALNAPGASGWLISNWAAAACILVSDHSNRALRLPTPSRQGRLQPSSTAPSLPCRGQGSQLRQPFNLHPCFDSAILHLREMVLGTIWGGNGRGLNPHPKPGRSVLLCPGTQLELALMATVPTLPRGKLWQEQAECSAALCAARLSTAG